ncbi:MAG: hypothetical protein HY903_04355 [Deltaproteobacteria bacterium]|nr:hypothetical protein [Deltaproteobacteria bacterium]
MQPTVRMALPVVSLLIDFGCGPAALVPADDARPTDAPTDTGNDAGGDPGSDAGNDVAGDAGSDVGGDAGSDVDAVSPGAPSVFFASSARTVREDVGRLSILVKLSAPSAVAVTVPYTVSGTALAGADFHVAAGSLTIDAGSTSGKISVSVTDDTVGETDETVVLTLGAPTHARFGARTTHTLTIIDNEVDFPGYQAGKIYLGYNVEDVPGELYADWHTGCPNGTTLAEEQTYTGPNPTRLARKFEGKIDFTADEVLEFETALAADRLGWVSFKGRKAGSAPDDPTYTWTQIADGEADSILQDKATMYQTVSGPGLVTFHHEPYQDGVVSEYVRAWHRILDVWEAAGGTGMITPCPVLNGNFLSTLESEDLLAEWMPNSLLARFRVIGFDAFDTGTYAKPGIPVDRTIRKWRQWLAARQQQIDDGHQRYLAVGATGVFYGSTRTSPRSSAFPDGYPGWDTVWGTLVANSSGDASYVAVNYYNAIINTRTGVDWSLRARRPTCLGCFDDGGPSTCTCAKDLSCDSSNGQPPPARGAADPSRVDAFKSSLGSASVAKISALLPR